MSHILDALQKVQEEKAAKLKQSAITAGILLEPSARRTNKKRLYLYGSVALLALCAVTLGIWVSVKPSRQDAGGMAAKPPQRMQPSALPPVPAGPPATVQAVVPPLPAAQPLAPPPALPQKDAQQQQPDRNKPKKTERLTPAVTPEPAGPVISAAPEGVKLTGIAWQDKRAIRRAVLNDDLVGEGSVVAGAKVIEIRPDMVRFEKNGTIFEATLPR